MLIVSHAQRRECELQECHRKVDVGIDYCDSLLGCFPVKTFGALEFIHDSSPSERSMTAIGRLIV